jgi:hypothetical protein
VAAFRHDKDNDAPEHFVKVYGNWRIERHTPVNGQMALAETREGRNIITTVGKSFLAAFLASAAAAASTFTCKYLVIGTGTGAESAGGTALDTETARHTGTVSTQANAIYQVIATFATGVGTGAITEYGLFSSNTAGTMFCRDLESSIAKGALDTLTATLQITLS